MAPRSTVARYLCNNMQCLLPEEFFQGPSIKERINKVFIAIKHWVYKVVEKTQLAYLDLTLTSKNMRKNSKT